MAERNAGTPASQTADTNVVTAVAETAGPSNCGVGLGFAGISGVIDRRRHVGVAEIGRKRGWRWRGRRR